MAAENCLWGAPRIHGELLKLGIAVSERTVSRYLRGRPTTRSQTWRTFFANHFGDQTSISPLSVADAQVDDIVIDACDLTFRSAPSINKSCASIHGPSVDGGAGSNPRPLAFVSVKHHLPDRTGARKSSGRGPPQALPSVALVSGPPSMLSFDRDQCQYEIIRQARGRDRQCPVPLSAPSSRHNRQKTEHFVRPAI